MGPQTRTETAIDYESTPLYVTTLRNATLTETISPTKTPYNTTSPGTGGTFYISFSSHHRSSLVEWARVKSKHPSTITYIVHDDLTHSGMANKSRFWISQDSQARPEMVKESNCRSCLQQYASNNDGFSTILCYGNSYFPCRLGPN